MLTKSTLLVATLAGLAAESALAQTEYQVSQEATMDRWMYPFNGSPGVRFNASTFSARRLEGFDDHDGQFIVGFDTSALIPAALDPSEYRVLSVTVRATISNDDQFRFDPTYDTQNTYDGLEEPYPGLIPDSDPGRPIHMWGLGYRDGVTYETFSEGIGFGINPVVAPAQQARVAYGAVFDQFATPTDISNSLKQEADYTPMAIGQAIGVAAGDLVPAETTFEFTIDLCDRGTQAYLAQNLAGGEIRLAISGLHFANGGEGGGTGDPTYPIWFTRENALAQILDYEPEIEIRARVGSPGDFNGDGNFNFFDLGEFLEAFNARDPAADLDGNCTFNFLDLGAFLTAFNEG